jgi:cytochrome c oxidase assembly protein subunit 15
MSLAHPLPAAAAPAGATASGLAAVRIWLLAVAGLVLLMVLVGGATRLTGSGLSITEWRPLTGAIPPLSEAAWLLEFEKYRAIPQYELMNKGMSLAEFKVIYWWEWGHRQLGRLIGLAYMLPLAVFWWQGIVRGRFALALLGLGLLGGLQGAIGWLMVASGLQPGMIAVAPVKLMLHLTMAATIFALLLWVALGLRRQPGGFSTLAARPGFSAASIANRAKLLVVLLLLQIALGALVAGSKAGLTYNTWPLMDGRLLPPAEHLFLADRPWIENFVDSPTLVQFNHRLTAYLLWALALWHAFACWRAARGTALARGALHVAIGITLQALLGIATLLLAVPLWAALAHQVFALLLLGAVVAHARRAHDAATGQLVPAQAASA